MRVQIDSRFPINMTVSADDFGKLFAAMNSAEQVAVLRSIVDEMDAHPLQWDYISIDLGSPENADTKRRFFEKAVYIAGKVEA